MDKEDVFCALVLCPGGLSLLCGVCWGCGAMQGRSSKNRVGVGGKWWLDFIPQEST